MRVQRRPRRPPDDEHSDTRTGSRSKVSGLCLFGGLGGVQGQACGRPIAPAGRRGPHSGPISATRSEAGLGNRPRCAVWGPFGGRTRSGIAMNAHPHRLSGCPGCRAGRGTRPGARKTGRSGHRAGSGGPAPAFRAPQAPPGCPARRNRHERARPLGPRWARRTAGRAGEPPCCPRRRPVRRPRTRPAADSAAGRAADLRRRRPPPHAPAARRPAGGREWGTCWSVGRRVSSSEPAVSRPRS